jgi:thiamine pyrophosphokinase
MPAEGTMGRGASPPDGPITVVFTGGDQPPQDAVDDLGPAGLVIAADSGVEHALALGFRVDLVVGDLDSADPAAVETAIGAGAAVERHPPAKDATDLELALDAARRLGGGNGVVVVGGAGGRLDHFLANVLLLASPAVADLHIRARVGDADIAVVRDAAELSGAPGDLCSLLALGGPATGVHTTGLRFPLDHEALLPGSTRGVSNELLEPTARVSLLDGVLLAVLPHARKAS